MVMFGFPKWIGTAGGVCNFERACLDVEKRAAHFL